MKSRERLLRALRMEKPDRLPATCHAWHDYHLKYFMGGMSALEAFKACGLDAVIAVPAGGPFESPQWRRRMVRETTNDAGNLVQDWEVQTPERTLTETTESNEYTIWVTKHLLDRDDDIELMRKYLPVPPVSRDEITKAKDELGDDGILRGWIPAGGGQSGIWQEAVEWYGLDWMLMATFTKPDWVHAFLKVLLEKRLAFVEQLTGAPYDIVETGGGSGSDTVISPEIFKTFGIPYDRPYHEALKAAGYFVAYHTCGGMKSLLELIPQNACTASETLTPSAMGGNLDNRRQVKTTLGRQVCLIGGMDQVHVLNEKDEAGIRADVQDLFATYGEGGGYIMATCDQFFDVPRKKLEIYARAAADCTY